MGKHIHSLSKTSDERRQAIRTLVASGMNFKDIAKELKCSTHTIAAVREMDAEPIAEESKVIARKWTNVAQMAVEQVSERLAAGEQATLKELSIVGAVATDKMVVLKGEPTARIAHERVEKYSELRQELEEAKAAAKEKVASIDIGAAVGAGASEARAATIKEAKAADIKAARLPEAAASSAPRESKTPAATGRGGSSEARRPPSQNDSPTEKISPNGPN